jgi:hypothetical protein
MWWPDGKGRGGQDGADGGLAKRERGVARQGGVCTRLGEEGGGGDGMGGSAGRGFVGAGGMGGCLNRKDVGDGRGQQGRVSEQRGRVKLAAWIMCTCGMLGPLVLHPVPHHWSRLC